MSIEFYKIKIILRVLRKKYCKSRDTCSVTNVGSIQLRTIGEKYFDNLTHTADTELSRQNKRSSGLPCHIRLVLVSALLKIY